MKVKVWNDNKYPHKEMFRGEMIEIGPGEFIEMEHMDAVQFKGQMSPIIRDADGAPTEKSFKKIRVEEPKADAKVASSDAELICQMCAYKAKDQVDLAKHILENHSESFAEKSRDEAGKRLQQVITKGR